MLEDTNLVASNVQKRKAVVDTKNMDARCFVWSSLAALHSHHKHNLTQINQRYYKYYSKPDLTSIYLVKLKNTLSKNIISITVDQVKLIVGFLYYTQTDFSGKFNYCLIKNLSCLVSLQINKREH